VVGDSTGANVMPLSQPQHWQDKGGKLSLSSYKLCSTKMVDPST
jgi:hypothetical protein